MCPELGLDHEAHVLEKVQDDGFALFLCIGSLLDSQDDAADEVMLGNDGGKIFTNSWKRIKAFSDSPFQDFKMENWGTQGISLRNSTLRINDEILKSTFTS